MNEATKWGFIALAVGAFFGYQYGKHAMGSMVKSTGTAAPTPSTTSNASGAQSTVSPEQFLVQHSYPYGSIDN